MTAAGLLGRVTSRSAFIPSLLGLLYRGHVTRDGRKVRMGDFLIPPVATSLNCPVLLLIGTSMSSGKTTSARVIIRRLKKMGLRVVGAKLTGAGRYVFPSVRTNSRPMSDNTVLAALRRMGFSNDEMTGHGFRAMARTILDEVLKVRVDFIEHQLAHEVKDPNGRAYNRTAFLPERRKMMQTWADYLSGLKEGAKVIPLRKVASD